jgi:hypothetical protein
MHRLESQPELWSNDSGNTRVDMRGRKTMVRAPHRPTRRSGRRMMTQTPIRAPPPPDDNIKRLQDQYYTRDRSSVLNDPVRAAELIRRNEILTIENHRLREALRLAHNELSSLRRQLLLLPQIIHRNMSVQTDKQSSPPPSNIQKLQLSEKLKSRAQTLATDRQKVIRSKINMLKKSSPVQENINIVNDEREREERMLSGSPRGSLDDKTCSRFVSPVRSPEESPDSFHSASSSHVSPLLTLNTTPTHLSGKDDRGVNTDMFTNKSSSKKQSRGQMKRRDSLQGLVR